MSRATRTVYAMRTRRKVRPPTPIIYQPLDRERIPLADWEPLGTRVLIPAGGEVWYVAILYPERPRVVDVHPLPTVAVFPIAAWFTMTSTPRTFS